MTEPFDPPEAACRGDYDADLWFSDWLPNIRLAKNICRGCPAVFGCLAYAIGNGEQYGVWGGVSMSARADAQERGRWRRRLNRNRPPEGDQR